MIDIVIHDSEGATSYAVPAAPALLHTQRATGQVHGKQIEVVLAPRACLTNVGLRNGIQARAANGHAQLVGMTIHQAEKVVVGMAREPTDEHATAVYEGIDGIQHVGIKRHV